VELIFVQAKYQQRHTIRLDTTASVPARNYGERKRAHATILRT
jgi:hypothetical protein